LLLQACLINKVINLHCLPLTEDLDCVLAVHALGQGLRNALERQHNNANASSTDKVVPRDSFDNSAGLVLLLILQKSTVNCLCLVCSCEVCGDNKCYLVSYKACARGQLSYNILSKAIKPC
jgi:hypothetical protein